MPKQPRVRRSAGERREEIAAAARAIALEDGLVAVTLRSVAGRVGVASGLVAHYEPSMDDLVATTFARIVADELAEVEQLIAFEDDPVAALRQLLHTLLDPERGDVTLVWVQAWALGGRNSALAETVRVQMDAWERFIASVVTRAAPTAAEDASAMARQILGMTDGLNAHSLVGWHDDTERYDLLTRSVEAMLSLPTGALRSA